MFTALVLTQQDKKTLASFQQLSEDELPQGNVLVDVEYSSLNYKDGLAITGKAPIARQFPMVPGIDLVGSVSQSTDARFNIGDKVVSTGWGVGENHWGGMAQKARLNGDWLIPLPTNLTAQQTMMIGTAGLTAMLCVQSLIDANIKPSDGDILVTGASGGVGSIAISLLASLNYQVVAVSGRVNENQRLLRQLGATQVIDRSEFECPSRPLDKQLWAGAVDTVGSKILAKVLSQVKYNGAVAACGLASGFDLPTTVMPFILRNIRLQGVDSVMCPTEKRQQAWQNLGNLLPEDYFTQACHEIPLNQVTEYAQAITNGQTTGRVIVKLS